MAQPPVSSLPRRCAVEPASSGTGERRILIRAADGSGAERMIWSGSGHNHLTSWSPDGKTILATFIVSGRASIYRVAVDTGKAEPWTTSTFREDHAVFSPDGRWVAYSSDEAG